LNSKPIPSKFETNGVAGFGQPLRRAQRSHPRGNRRARRRCRTRMERRALARRPRHRHHACARPAHFLRIPAPRLRTSFPRWLSARRRPALWRPPRRAHARRRRPYRPRQPKLRQCRPFRLCAQQHRHLPQGRLARKLARSFGSAGLKSSPTPSLQLKALSGKPTCAGLRTSTVWQHV
jgi:hypothetical protein